MATCAIVLVLLLSTAFPLCNTCSLIILSPSLEIFKENFYKKSLYEKIFPHIKKPRELLPGALSTFMKYCAFFSHPDFTVGSGISPDQPPKRVADYTAGRELHPAPKKFFFYEFIITHSFFNYKP